MPLSMIQSAHISSHDCSWAVADGTNPASTDIGAVPGDSWFVGQILASNKGATERTVTVALKIFGDFTYLGSVVVPAAVGSIPGTVDVLAALPPAWSKGFPIDALHVDVWFNLNAAVVADYDVQVFLSVFF